MKLNIKKQLGLRIKQLRQQKGYSQEQLAEKIGIATHTMCGIERGKNFLTADTLENILTELDVTPQELFLINHLQPQSVLIEEIINTIKSIKDREKIEILYKIVKSFV